mmetsp:Transcript_123914/g.309709  ORF Transcript_123914/g.309709 Transcript_123914/m.309709 type:complete len:84 (+) Transcript_123914:1198-1449(+)
MVQASLSMYWKEGMAGVLMAHHLAALPQRSLSNHPDNYLAVSAPVIEFAAEKQMMCCCAQPALLNLQGNSHAELSPANDWGKA